jgi:hypothetical protein
VNINDTAYQTVHDYPGGSEALGPRIGMSPAVLRNKVNPNNTTHHLTLAEASNIIGVSGDFRILHAFNAEHGCTTQRVDAAPDQPVLNLMLEQRAKDGAFAQAVADALTDGVITPNEARKIADAGACMQEATLLLLSKLGTMSGKRVSA